MNKPITPCLCIDNKAEGAGRVMQAYLKKKKFDIGKLLHTKAKSVNTFSSPLY